MLQVKHLTDMVNTIEARSAEQKVQYRKQIETLEKDVQRLQAQQRDRESLSPGQQSIGTTGSIDGKRSPKHPDPPTLTDGVDPTFKEWETCLRNKLLFNQDWFEDVQEARTHAKQVAYI